MYSSKINTPHPLHTPSTPPKCWIYFENELHFWRKKIWKERSYFPVSDTKFQVPNTSSFCLHVMITEQSCWLPLSACDDHLTKLSFFFFFLYMVWKPQKCELRVFPITLKFKGMCMYSCCFYCTGNIIIIILLHYCRERCLIRYILFRKKRKSVISNVSFFFLYGRASVSFTLYYMCVFITKKW